MKTKVKITIEVEELWEDTNLLVDKIMNDDLLVSDIFNSKAKIIINRYTTKYTSVDPDSGKEPEPLIIEGIMVTRGIKIDN